MVFNRPSPAMSVFLTEPEEEEGHRTPYCMRETEATTSKCGCCSNCPAEAGGLGHEGLCPQQQQQQKELCPPPAAFPRLHGQRVGGGDPLCMMTRGPNILNFLPGSQGQKIIKPAFLYKLPRCQTPKSHRCCSSPSLCHHSFFIVQGSHSTNGSERPADVELRGEPRQTQWADSRQIGAKSW